MPEALSAAMAAVFTPAVLTAILVAAVYGVFFGAVPGLTATMAVALMVPATFFLDDVSALAAIITMEACCIFAGDIPAVLVRIPGTPSSAAYTDDAYELTRHGRHQEALGVSLVFSAVGGLFGSLVFIVAAPQLAKFAFDFTTYEEFWLYALGLSCAAVVSHGSRLKGLLALLLGVLLSTPGLSDAHASPRLTFGRDELISGINFIPAMIGLFGLSEVMRSMMRLKASEPVAVAPTGPAPAPTVGLLRRLLLDPLSAVFAGIAVKLWKAKFRFMRSSVVGTAIGILPGAGADIAAWISYGLSKRFSSEPEKYGKGSTEGLADAAAANNASLAGAWVPALVFGIPGDSVTAIVIGVLMMKNIIPGPHIFTDAKQAVLVNSLYVSFVLANLVLIPVGFAAIRCGSLLVRIPRRVLLPIIVLFCVVGSYALNGSLFDVGVMLAMGVVGLALEAWGIPPGPVVLGIVLGGPLEHRFLQNIAKSDSLVDFFTRPLSAGIAVCVLLLWVAPLLGTAWRRLREPAPSN